MTTAAILLLSIALTLSLALNFYFWCIKLPELEETLQQGRKDLKDINERIKLLEDERCPICGLIHH